jgi:3-phosphoshikimate 1-carboxyvinyltransferase
LSHRALTAAALAQGTSVIRGLSGSEDVTRTREALAAAGAVFSQKAPDLWEVRGLSGPLRGGGNRVLSLDMGESGTSCRLLSAVSAAGRGRFLIRGEGRMDKRPMRALTSVLETLGTRFEFYGEAGHTPFLLIAAGLDGPAGAECAVDCSESGQYLSGLLLAAPLSRSGLRLRPSSRYAASLPYVGLTLEVMSAFGAAFSIEAGIGGKTAAPEPADLARAVAGSPNGARDILFAVPAGAYRATDYSVEGDWSGASYFLAAGAVGPRAVRVSGLNPRSLQGDAVFLRLLESMGARVETEGGGVTVFPSQLRGIRADMGDCPDLAPTLAALATYASGPTVITNAAHLKLKESDRIAAPAEELPKVGCVVTVTDDGLIITPPEGGPRRPDDRVVFSARDDHRMAMSLALLGLPGRGGEGFAVRLDNPGCVAKSFPNFWQCWEKLGAAPCL